MPILHDGLAEYLDAHVPERAYELQKMEQYAADNKFPIVGPAAGHFLYSIALLSGARRILELGSGYGYSTAWFARAVDENGGGTVTHTVWDQELSRMARSHLGSLGYPPLEDMIEAKTSIIYIVDEAIKATESLTGPYDLIFCDIDKEGYPKAESVAYDFLAPGGIFITDNVLWSGKVVVEAESDPQTAAIKTFNTKMRDRERWNSSIIPIRDGLMMSIKRGDS